MNEVYSINNDKLSIAVKTIGAELCSLKSVVQKKEFMWDANPAVWAGSAPVLFPIIGALKDDSYFYKNQAYMLPRHGFLRTSEEIILLSKTEDCLTFGLNSNANTLLQYPFEFEFNISFRLEKNSLQVEHKVINTGENDMFFSLGGHPAFKCPIEKYENYNDYFIEFEHPETAYTYQIEPTGLIGPKTDLVLNNSKIINLHNRLFDKGALVFKSLKSKKAHLISKVSGKRLTVSFKGFPYLGIWAKQNANFVCIEPWLGIADSVDTNRQFETKEGIIKLEAGKSFDATYSITIEGI